MFVVKVIEIENLNYSYTDERLVLNDVSLSIDEGEYVSIVGHNGCGKSTLCKLMIGLLEKKSGSIIVNGQELNSSTISILVLAFVVPSKTKCFISIASNSLEIIGNT